MNGKKAKQLRQEARRRTVGRPWDKLKARENFDRFHTRPKGARAEHDGGSGAHIYKILKDSYHGA
jgi:hypothetical protein